MMSFERITGTLLRTAVVLVFIFIFLPLVIVVIGAFDVSEIVTFPVPGITLRWFGEFMMDQALLTALKNSLMIGGAATLFSVALGLPAAIAAVRFRFRGKNVFSSLLIAPLIVPPVITGVSLASFLYFVGVPKGLAWILIGHTIMVTPYVFLVVQAPLTLLNPKLEEAALVLGANELRAFREVTLPLILPALGSGMMFAFLTSLDEFAATQFWVVPATETIPIGVYTALMHGVSPKINVLGMILIIFALIVPTIALRVRQRTTVKL